MVDQRDTEIFFKYFLTGKLKREEPKRRSTVKSEKLNNNFDKLFFNFLIITAPELLYDGYDLTKGRKLKYEMSHKMENMKFKKIDTVTTNLCYDEKITLHTLGALFCLFNKRLVFHNDNVFCCLNESTNELSDLCYVVTSNKEIYMTNKEKVNIMKNNSFVISEITKPLYSLTHYKISDLKDIIEQLNIELEDKKYIKKELYEIITKYVHNSLY